jgi:hypothetical protein
MNAARAAAAGVAALLGASLVGLVLVNVALHRGVTVGAWAVQTASVLPTPGGLVLEDIVAESSALRVEARSARVGWSLGSAVFPLLRVRLKGGDSRHEEGEGDAGRSARAFDVTAERLEVHEGDASADAFVATNVRLARHDDRSLELAVARGEVERSGLALGFEGLEARRSADRTWSLAVGHVRVHGEGGEGAHGSEKTEPRDHVEVAGDVLEVLFLRGREALDRAVGRVPRGTYRVERVDLEELPWLGRAGLQAENFLLVREGDDLRVDAALATPESRAPLTLAAQASRWSHRVVADVKGGPLVLRRDDGKRAELESDGRLVFDAALRSLDAHGSLGVRGLRVQRRWLGGEPFEVTGRVAGRFSLDPSGGFALEGATFEVGDQRELRGRLDAHGNLRALTTRLDASLEPFACNAGVRALPAPFRSTVGQLRFEGTKSLSVHLETSAADPEGTRFDVREQGSCTATSAPTSLAPEAFDGAFVIPVVGADGRERLETFGPGTEHWRPLARVSKAFLAAVLTTEDAGFYRHKGVSWFAMRSALVDDVRARRFVRGGSTITMQLAKNLFLRRDKTLGRKLEEVLLTDYLEDAFGKERILELYANIVELGPDVFGIEAAAQHHFGVSAEELGVLEGFWLATLLPNPRERAHARKDGTVSEGKLKELRFLVRKARSHGLLTDEDVDEAERGTLHMPRMAGEAPRVPGLGIQAPPPRGRGEAAIEGP